MQAVAQEASTDQPRERAEEMVERFLDLTFAPLILAGLSGHQAATSADAVDRQIDFALDALAHTGLLQNVAAAPEHG